MTERPILFSGPTMRAILEGRKTQSRRIAIPKRCCIDFIGGGPKDGPEWNDPACWGFEDANTGVWWSLRSDDQCRQLPCPYGQPGDRLWVRETTYDVERNGYVGPVFVESDEGAHVAAWGWGEPNDPDYIEPYKLRKRPAIHMPRWASRITLEITAVRAERLHSSGEPDARVEGVTIADHHLRGYRADAYRPPSIRAFHELWDNLNATRGHGWDTNPWVWVIEFKRIG
ncbi:hypothetical protein BPS26883_04676 [Burkholderia pseudomultivorans]|uniref:Morphogenetic protein n=1 Tax=Burkholderia pseudomultivorans TaxID=1207504 RepID=A0A6P2NPZ0_9BURK|nr:hypothetical protein [Burkholderia pseudomultivorans]VWB96673.1 hypothetical protein BPS26883_04676 [Burkholderia pseudomultivorans]